MYAGVQRKGSLMGSLAITTADHAERRVSQGIGGLGVSLYIVE